MAKFRLLPPRAPEGNSTKKKIAFHARACGTTNMDSSTPEDTIKVTQNRTATVDLTESDADSPLSSSDEEAVLPAAVANHVTTTSQPNRTRVRESKALDREAHKKQEDQQSEDFEMIDAQDDDVEEYDFSNEPDDIEEEDDVNDTAYYKYPDGAMPLSDDEDDDRKESNAISPPDGRPWKNFGMRARVDWELMYCQIPQEAMKGSWEVTEEYQREKDKEMHKYVEDFPVPQWVIPQEQAMAAYHSLLERTRWRGLGIRIFSESRAPEWTPDSASTHQMQLPQMPGHQQHHQVQQMQRGSQSMGPPQAQQHMSHRPWIHAPSQSMMPAFPHGLPNNVPQRLPPHEVLRSQPNAQPIPTYPNGTPIHQSSSQPAVRRASSHVARNNVAPVQSTYPRSPHQISPMEADNKSKARMPKPTAPLQDLNLPPPSVPVPPYELREKPSERRGTKTGRTQKRKHAEADEFPWNRQIDFIKARAEATWDDSIYPQSTLDDMAKTRALNEPIIDKIDAEETEKQRLQRVASRKRKEEGGPGSDEPTRTRTRKKAPSNEPKDEEGGSSDPYHSGSFCFASQGDMDRASATGRKTPDELMIDAKKGHVSLVGCAQIFICWNPTKKGVSEGLQQARFSIRDTLLTRDQLKRTPVLTRRAAECIVDFCPDMLFRGMLLRITSEAGYGNKEVRDRMAHNGNYADKATITKRIGAALGQKQAQSQARKGKGYKSGQAIVQPEAVFAKDKGYGEGEMDYYNVNIKDFANYVEFYGKRTSQRSQLKLQPLGIKRKHSLVDAAEGSRPRISLNLRKRSTDDEATQSPEGMNVDGDETEAVTSEESSSEVESDEVDGGRVEDDSKRERADDEVSEQSDTMLDAMDD